MSNKSDLVEHNKPTHVIGIGASAGGLEALQGLFQAMPANLNVAFVVVQHLSPDFKSMMDELLSKNTLMPTHQAVEGEELKSNSVYLIPAGKLMRIVEGRIYLSDLPPDNRINLPINEFFRSLAEDKQNHAVGIILSGTGSDGSRGVQALKEVGALVIAQKPDEAQFDGMPLNAINTGSVDFVLSVSEMADQIERFVKHPLHADSTKDFRVHLSENTEVLEKVLKLIEEKTELDFRAYKESTVSRRIEHRISINNKSSITEYYAYLSSHPEEVELIKQDLLIGVTQFFRDMEVWESIYKEVMLKIVTRYKGDTLRDTIRVWCAGCSTGEEAYTIAMLFQEAIEDVGSDEQIVKVFASDIDQSAVAYAANGVYPSSISTEVPKHYLGKYFNRLADGSYQVSKELRSSVVFATHNLIQDPPFSNMDFISCRNTLIYLQSPAQQKALAFFHFALKLNGYLLLGTAETTNEFSIYFEAVVNRLRIYQKIKDLRIPMTNLNGANMRQKTSYQIKSLPQFIAKANGFKDRHHSRKPNGIQDALLEEFLPPTLVFNQRLQLVYSFGDTSVFTAKIKPGRVTNELSDVLITELANTALSAAHEVMKENQSVLYENAYSEVLEGTKHFWSLKALPITRERESSDSEYEPYVAISFIKDDSNQVAKSELSYKINQLDAHKIKQLDQALLDCQELYREALENLDTTSEELQSSNEELMAANEELQSTNEELQSVNEELYTVNSEYQQKIAELSNTNNDLEALLKATNMAIIFLDRHLKIRRFTDAMKEFVNIIDFDVDREFSDLSLKYELKNLHSDIVKINKSGVEAVKTYKVDGEVIEVKVIPYSHRNLSVGVVVTFKKV